MTTHPLPELYARWAADLLPGGVPGEPLSTCHDCAMCVKPDGTAPTAVYFFRADVKCCVYLPKLPNFLVGRALNEPDGAGRRSVEARIAAGIGVTPIGLGRPPAWDLQFEGSVNAVGRSRSLRCPHFIEEGGLCGIWRQRDAMCSTWFCRHARGQVGSAFWAALRDLLSVVEAALSRWAAREEGIPAEVLVPFLPRQEHDKGQDLPPDGPALDGLPDPWLRAAQWGARLGAEAEFYRACARRVDALTWADIERIGGVEVAIRADLVRKRWNEHADRTLPEHLVVGRFEIVGRRPDGIRVVTYSSLDALDLPNALVGLLPLFDGRPTEDVREVMRANWNVDLDDAFLGALVDWGILIPAY